MISKTVALLIIILFMAAPVFAGEQPAKSTAQKDEDKTININLPLPICTKAKLTFWLIENQLQSVKDLVFQLKGCSAKGDTTVCSFAVTNCGDRGGWFYLEASSNLYDSNGMSYELRKKSIAGSSSGPDGMAKTFLNSGQTEPGVLTFDKTSAENTDYSVSVVLTGGQWAGDMHKTVFKNVKIAR
ncbi:MAG: hypothetical protein LLF86_07425 [Nitrospiraceae bacterium]|nr:hypothetical protein [Nitrospiraceae bacterium]